jgi:hypothetical protein
MATIPQYKPQVRDEALRPVFQNTPDVSSGAQALARGMMQVAEVADQIDLRDAKVKADEVDATITTEWLRWDAENRQKYRGQNVDAYAPAAEEWWKKAAETYGKDLSPRARQIASTSLVRKQGSALANVTQFVGAEKERHADDAASASITSTIQFGVTTGDVAGAAQQVRSQVAAVGARKGWTTEQVQAEQLKNLSQLHLAQITKLASVDANAAQAYYQANKGEVIAANQPRIEEVIKGESDNQFSTQFAASVANKPLSEQLAEAAKITDPERREKTLTQIRNNHALVKQAEAEQENAAADQAWQLFAQGRQVPEAILSQMAGRERVQLQEAGRTRAERAAAGRAVKTDPVTYIELRERLARGEKVDLRGYTEKVSQGDLEKLIDIQTTAAKPGQQDSMISDEARISAALVGLGIDKKSDPESAVRLTTEIDRRVREASAAKGNKPLTPDEKQMVVDRVVLDKVYVDEWGTDPEKPIALLEPDEMADAYVKVDGKNIKVSSVPQTDRRQIIAALRATGQAVTEQNIVRLYVDGKKKGPAK